MDSAAAHPNSRCPTPLPPAVVSVFRPVLAASFVLDGLPLRETGCQCHTRGHRRLTARHRWGTNSGMRKGSSLDFNLPDNNVHVWIRITA
jgi:hypothetical protein